MLPEWKPLPVSPLAPPDGFPDLPRIAGTSFAVAQAGIKYSGREDVMLVRMARGTAIAGVFTLSNTRSSAVLDCQAKLGGSPEPGATFLVNSGNANAFTGSEGMQATQTITRMVSQVTDVPESRVFTASTGVIGEKLPHDRICNQLNALAASLAADQLPAAARAIMTTDTFAKGAGSSLHIAGKRVNIAGIAKGSGMIAPNMATMLAFVFTDAKIPQPGLQRLVACAADQTFNCITVDGDTSTSDTVLVAATGASGCNVTDEPAFAEALEGVMRDLAQQIVCDGEGASKFVEIAISGALDDADARCHAMSIGNSPLVKTALAGGDPNWGRIVMAIGKSGAAVERDRVTIRFGSCRVAERGEVAPGHDEARAAAYLKGSKINISVDLGIGSGQAVVWTCDLGHSYVSINADYRS